MCWAWYCDELSFAFEFQLARELRDTIKKAWNYGTVLERLEGNAIRGMGQKMEARRIKVVAMEKELVRQHA